MADTFTPNKAMITSAFVQEFHKGWEVATQQKESRLVQCVTNRGKVTGASFTINDLGSIEMQKRTTRFADTTWQLPEAGTRICPLVDYDVYLPLEPLDLPKLIANPQGQYMQLMVNANNRTKDDAVYRGLLDDITRKNEANGTLSATKLPASQTIAAGTGAAGIFTLDKLLQIRAMFRANEADEMNGEELFLAYNSVMLQQLLATDKLTSADYTTVKALQAGKMNDTFMGFTWVPFERLDKVPGAAGAADTYQTVAWAKSGAHFGTGIDYNTDVGPRRDKSNTIQLSANTSFACGRANEQKVVKIGFLSKGA